MYIYMHATIYSSLYVHINSHAYSGIMLILFKAYHEAITVVYAFKQTLISSIVAM